MLPGPAPEKVSWNPVLITISIGILLAIVSFVVATSQWGRPTTSVATVRPFGVLFALSDQTEFEAIIGVTVAGKGAPTLEPAKDGSDA
jgi:hypothetical protein